MNNQHYTHEGGREPYPWTLGWEPVLSPEDLRIARCDSCGGRANYVRFVDHTRYPGEDVSALLHCGCTPDGPPHDWEARAQELAPRLGSYEAAYAELAKEVLPSGCYADIELAELADPVEGPDWAQHLAAKCWWRDAGAAALLARFGRPAPDDPTNPLVELGKVLYRADAYRRRMAELSHVVGFYGLTDRLCVDRAAHEAALLITAALDQAEETERIGRESGRIG